ncbi:MAG TPA: TonB family protein [Candidatus Polarisedimenticolia bacterium]|nr:TonB family protein [Candidatus Polarisedimenticolia bacterium]
MHLRRLATLVLCMAIGPPAAATSVTTSEIAQVIRDAKKPESVQTLRQGLKESSPETRAAAGRVINTTRTSGVLEELRQALLVEKEPWVAAELSAALLSVGTSEDIQRIADMGRRLGGAIQGRLALQFARVMGPAAVDIYFNDLAGLPFSRALRSSFFRLSSRKDTSTLNAIGVRLLEAVDGEGWAALLDVARESRMRIEEKLLAEALKHPDAAIAVPAAWQGARIFAKARPGDAASLLAAISTAQDQTSAPLDPDARFGHEVLARVLSREPTPDDAWLEQVRTAERIRMDELDVARDLIPFLTDTEKQRLRKRLHRRFPGTKSQHLFDKRPPAIDLAAAGPLQSPPPIRMASGYPQGFVKSVIEGAGCRLPERPSLLKSLVTFDLQGRPSKVVLLSTAASTECTAAASAVLATSLATPGRLTDPLVPETLFLILDRSRLSTIEDTSPDEEADYLADDVTPPRRTHFVAPVYPDTARVGSRGGKSILEIVVNREGTVSDMRLLKQTGGEDLMAAAFLAVSQWRYAPARRHGRPVKAYLTVIIDWNLR